MKVENATGGAGWGGILEAQFFYLKFEMSIRHLSRDTQL